MPFFDINFQSFVRQLLPVRLRQSKTIRWLQCLITPVIELYHTFSDNRTNNLYILSHNSQVVYLQAALNDVFDPISRRIYIIDGGTSDPLYIYLVAEIQPTWLGLVAEIGSTFYSNPQWLYTNTEAASSVNSFVIRVPVSITFDTYRMKALIDKYRLAGKNIYAIETF